MDDITILFHLLATAPPWAQRVVAGLVVAVALATVYMRAYPKLQALAATTETKRDDQAVGAGAFVARWVLALFGWVKWVPRLEVGEPKAPATPPGSDDAPPTRPQRRVPRELPPLVVFAFWAACTGTALYVSGCGPTQAESMQRGLSAATDLADPLYLEAVTECDLQEGEVIASHAPDEGEAAAAALSQVRQRCDVAFASFEELRMTQLVLRATADALEDGRATTTDLVRSLDEMTAAYQATRELVAAIRAARRGAL